MSSSGPLGGGRVDVRMWAFTCRGQSLGLDAPPTLSSLKQGLSLNQELTHWPDCLTDEPRALPVSLLPCWGYSHPPDFPVWPLWIRTRVLMLVPRPFTDWAISPASSWKRPFPSFVHNSSIRCLRGQPRQHPHFYLNPASLLNIRLLTPFIQKGRNGWWVCMMSSH